MFVPMKGLNPSSRMTTFICTGVTNGCHKTMKNYSICASSEFKKDTQISFVQNRSIFMFPFLQLGSPTPTFLN